MNVIRRIEKSSNGKLVIDLPFDFQNKELEVTISPLEEQEHVDLKKQLRIETILRFKGIFKNSSYKINEGAWYEQ